MSLMWLPQRQESLGVHSSVPMQQITPKLSGLTDMHIVPHNLCGSGISAAWLSPSVRGFWSPGAS